MKNTSDRTRKLLIRSALVTTSTIATLVGAQNFATLDASQFQMTGTPNPQNQSAASNPNPAIVHLAPNIEIAHTAPSITILRQAGQTNLTPIPLSVAQAPTVAQPQIIYVQEAAPQRSGSSR